MDEGTRYKHTRQFGVISEYTVGWMGNVERKSKVGWDRTENCCYLKIFAQTTLDWMELDGTREQADGWVMYKTIPERRV